MYKLAVRFPCDNDYNKQTETYTRFGTLQRELFIHEKQTFKFTSSLMNGTRADKMVKIMNPRMFDITPHGDTYTLTNKSNTTFPGTKEDPTVEVGKSAEFPINRAFNVPVCSKCELRARGPAPDEIHTVPLDAPLDYMQFGLLRIPPLSREKFAGVKRDYAGSLVERDGPGAAGPIPPLSQEIFTTDKPVVNDTIVIPSTPPQASDYSIVFSHGTWPNPMEEILTQPFELGETRFILKSQMKAMFPQSSDFDHLPEAFLSVTLQEDGYMTATVRTTYRQFGVALQTERPYAYLIPAELQANGVLGATGHKNLTLNHKVVFMPPSGKMYLVQIVKRD